MAAMAAASAGPPRAIEEAIADQILPFTRCGANVWIGLKLPYRKRPIVAACAPV